MLICTNCGKRYPLDTHMQRCEICNEPLELELFKGIKYGKGNVWERYREFYPYINFNMEYSLGEGDTPLVYSYNLSQTLKNEIYLKNEGMNPTWSFKDRGTFIAINYAKSEGFSKIGVVSTGNMAASVAAYGSRAKIKTYVFVSSKISSEKLSQISVYSPSIIRVEGDYGDLYYKSLEIGEKKGIYFINSDNPLRIEGYKSIAYEISEIIEPDYVILPTSSGGLFRGIYKGFRELKESGILDSMPIMVAVQAEGCAPICNAFENGKEKIERLEKFSTIAHAIENPYPPSGNEVLRILKKIRGKCIKITDEDILKSQRSLALEGIFVQPASAITLAAIEKLKISDKKIVLILTGSGLKVRSKENENIPICNIEELENCVEVL